MTPSFARRTLGCAALLAALTVPVVTQAEGGPPPDIMPRPLVGYQPLAASGPLAFATAKADFIRQIAHLAQKSGYRVLDQRIYYCPRPKGLPDASEYPQWEAIDMSTGNAIFDRFGHAVERVSSASRPISVLFQIHTPTPGYVMVSGYYLPREIGGGALIANTILEKT